MMEIVMTDHNHVKQDSLACAVAHLQTKDSGFDYELQDCFELNPTRIKVPANYYAIITQVHVIIKENKDIVMSASNQAVKYTVYAGVGDPTKVFANTVVFFTGDIEVTATTSTVHVHYILVKQKHKIKWTTAI